MNHLAGKRYLWFAISLIVIIPGLISLLFAGLKLGIDFTGGTQYQVQFNEDVDVESSRITEALASLGYEDTIVQPIDVTGGNAYQIKMPELPAGESPEKARLDQALTERVGPFTELSISSIGSSVSQAITRNSFLAVAVASAGILAYIAFAFRNTRSPMLYGTCAIVAMLHDALVVVGVFSILGVVAGVQIDALFVTALLTVIGFSVHDTIVVFDRIRENLARRTSATFEETVNYSIAQTIVRSLNTSVTVVFTLLALYLFGGATTQEFVLALLIGVISGTYSSIFNASQLLVAWENGEIQRFFGRLIGRGSGPVVQPSR
jgi:preprotein translocase subunit SecF